MPYIEIGTEKNEKVLLSYVDYGQGKPVILIHSWPLSHRMWEKQIIALVEAGYRAISYDRRGFGESYKPWDGYNYDTLADDLDTLITKLDLHEVTLVGFSMGGGEIARYLSRHGSERIAKTVLMSSVTPYLKQSDDNPDGAPAKIFEDMMAQMLADRPAFLEDFGKQFYNVGTLKKPVSQAQLNYDWSIAVHASPRATLACAEAFADTDFRQDMAGFTMPTLIVHGDADQTVPFAVSGKRAHDAIPSSQLEIIAGGPHGIPVTHASQVNEILLKFLQN